MINFVFLTFFSSRFKRVIAWRICGEKCTKHIISLPKYLDWTILNNLFTHIKNSELYFLNFERCLPHSIYYRFFFAISPKIRTLAHTYIIDLGALMHTRVSLLRPKLVKFCSGLILTFSVLHNRKLWRWSSSRSVHEIAEKRTGWAGIIAATLRLKVRQVHALHCGPCAGAAGNSGDGRVLPGSMEMQMWEQALHAVINNHEFTDGYYCRYWWCM